MLLSNCPIKHYDNLCATKNTLKLRLKNFSSKNIFAPFTNTVFLFYFYIFFARDDYSADADYIRRRSLRYWSADVRIRTRSSLALLLTELPMDGKFKNRLLERFRYLQLIHPRLNIFVNRYITVTLDIRIQLILKCDPTRHTCFFSFCKND